MTSRISILVPTRNDDVETIHLDHLLHSLLMQSFRDFRILIRDEGRVGVFERRAVRQFADLLSRCGIGVEYRRVQNATGIAVARRELVASGSGSEMCCFVDDDMCLSPNALAVLVEVAESIPGAGFVQGQKIEADVRREYWNDINRLNGSPLDADVVPIHFGDTALLLIRSSAFEAVDWDLVTRFRVDGLTGEDVAMSIMIADRFPCFGATRAVGYHLSPRKTRWIWEAPSDLLQLELLRSRVRPETLRAALPHLAQYVTD